MRLKSFPDYEHLLQVNYVEYKHIFLLKCTNILKITSFVTFFKKICLYSMYSSFLVIIACNQGKTLCSLYI